MISSHFAPLSLSLRRLTAVTVLSGISLLSASSARAQAPGDPQLNFQPDAIHGPGVPQQVNATATVAFNWTQPFQSPSPSARTNPTLAFDTATNTLVLFGGHGASGDLNDTWTYSSGTWTQQFPATVPPARNSSVMAYYAPTSSMIMFSGTNYAADTWSWNGVNWTLLAPANSPPARLRSSMDYDAATQQLVFFGGFDSSYSVYGDTWTWNGTTWTQQSPATAPPGRADSIMTYNPVNQTMVMFGGLSTSYTAIGDTWTYNGTTWTQQSPATSPSVRYFSSMAYDALTQTVILFGGYSASSTDLGDTWSYNGTTWTQQSPPTSPSARHNSYMAYSPANSKLILFGGQLVGALLSETWAYGTGATVPATNVAFAAAQTPVYFNITGSGALGTTQVLTQGAANLDFTLGTGSTCTGSVTSGSTCVVNVAFNPTAPGQRLGAVNLVSGSNVIATALISGTGTGPLLTLSPGLIGTVAGNGTGGYTASQDTGTTAATAASLFNPQSVAVDGAGNLYIADEGNNRIRKVTAATGNISTVAGNGAAGYTASQDTGTTAATAASLSAPSGVAVDGAGNLYIADFSNQRIRKVTAPIAPAVTGTISTVAGNGTAGYTASQDTGTTAATAASLNGPLGVAVDGAGNLYIADFANQRIRKVTAATGNISTVAGNGTACAAPTASPACGDGTAATAASLNGPYGVSVDGAGNLYIADNNTNRIRKVTAATGFISTVAGNGTGGYTASQDTGTTAATAASLQYPTGVAVDGAGNLYIADELNNRIRKVTAATGNISTVTGNATAGYTASQDTGTTAATAASLYYPEGVAVDGAGNLYIADYINNRIRKVSTTGSIVFPTATAAGSADTTDGTKTLIANNIGNATLTFASQVETGSSFVLGNPMTGGCVPNGTIAAGGSCLIGATFAPVAGTSGLVAGSVTLTDNSLNATAATQSFPQVGSTTANAVVVTVGNVTAKTGAASATLQYSYGQSGSTADTGAITITVNGSATGVGASTCVKKASHSNCTFPYTGTALATPGSYTISVAIAASSPYAAASATGTLTINSTGMGIITPPQTVTTPVTLTATPAPSRTVTAPILWQSPIDSPASSLTPAVETPADPASSDSPAADADTRKGQPRQP